LEFDCFVPKHFSFDFAVQLLELFDWLHLVFVIAFCIYSRWLKNLED